MFEVTENRPPQQLDGADVVCFASLIGLQKTDVCTHSVNGQVQDAFECLVIARYQDDDGAYLFYCNKAWSVENDTLHQSVVEAKQFADQQYPGVTNRWVSA